MAPGNADNKKQIIIIIFAVAAGIVASALVGHFVSSKVNEETTRLSLQYEKAQKQKEQQYNEQFVAMGQKMAQVEDNARKAAEEAARLAQQAAAEQKKEGGGKKKSAVSLALRTPPGKRALTLQLESLNTVGGLINPGDFVDVIAHLDVPVNQKKEDGTVAKEPVTAMIFQQLQVLAINTNLDEPGVYEEQQKERLLKITFAVSPEEAGLLAFAEKNGKLELALRSPAEKTRKMLSSATWTSLAEYVLENNGADIQASGSVFQPEVDEVETQDLEVQEPRPYIQIYRGGREL